MQKDSITIQDRHTDSEGFVGEPEKARMLNSNSSKETFDNDQDLKQSSQKLKIQNEKLRSQLKELSYKLTETLEKVKNKKNPEKTANELREETLRRELENAARQNYSYQKEIEKLKYKLNATHTEDRVTQLENTLKDKDRVIEELTIEKRNLEKIKRDQEKQNDVLRNDRDYLTKLNMYVEEVKGLKEKIRELQRHAKHEEKSFKKQQEYLVILEGKYREVCEKAGVSSSLNFTTAQEINDNKQKFKSIKVQDGEHSSKDLKKLGPHSAKNGLRSVERMEKASGDSEKMELTEAKFKELNNIIQILKKSKGTTDKKNKLESDQLLLKIRDLENENGRLKLELRDKEKELNICVYKFNELKRISKNNQLTPIETQLNPISKASEKSTDKLRSPSQQTTNKVIRPSPRVSQPTKRIDKKGRVNAKVPEFDDSSVVDKDAKISKLTVWYDKDQIYGLRATYLSANGTEVLGTEHLLVEQKDKLESQVIQVDTDDHITVISGKYKDFIGYLKIATLQGKTQEFGYENGKNSAQPFIFDLESNETASLVFGGLDQIDEKNSALAYLGFQFGKEDAKTDFKSQA